MAISQVSASDHLDFMECPVQGGIPLTISGEADCQEFPWPGFMDRDFARGHALEFAQVCIGGPWHDGSFRLAISRTMPPGWPLVRPVGRASGLFWSLAPPRSSEPGFHQAIARRTCGSTLNRTCVRSFVRSCDRAIVRSFVRSIVRSIVRSFVRSLHPEKHACAANCASYLWATAVAWYRSIERTHLIESEH